MKVLVELTPFPSIPDQSLKVREVEIPHSTDWDVQHTLETVYKQGQNDINPQPMRSVSCGDVIKYHGVRYLICGIGFKVLQPDEPSPGTIEAILMNAGWV